MSSKFQNVQLSLWDYFERDAKPVHKNAGPSNPKVSASSRTNAVLPRGWSSYEALDNSHVGATTWVSNLEAIASECLNRNKHELHNITGPVIDPSEYHELANEADVVRASTIFIWYQIDVVLKVQGLSFKTKSEQKAPQGRFDVCYTLDSGKVFCVIEYKRQGTVLRKSFEKAEYKNEFDHPDDHGFKQDKNMSTIMKQMTKYASPSGNAKANEDGSGCSFVAVLDYDALFIANFGQFDGQTDWKETIICGGLVDKQQGNLLKTVLGFILNAYNSCAKGS